MATVTEKVDSREWTTGENPAVTLHYIVDGTASDTAAKSALLAAAPSTYEDLDRDECTLEPIFVDTATGRGKWDCSVRYVTNAPPEVGESSFSFDTGGGTQHVTQSISTTNKYAPAGKTAPDFKWAVGVTHDNVEGVDITVPVYSFSETHYLADATVTEAYRGTLFNLTGKTNNASFKGLAAGECLFLGASGSKRGVDDWEISFRFAASPNRTGLTVGDITSIAKKGWEYMWVRYADAEDVTAKAIVKKPIAVYIEKVYDEGSFSELGIGV
ncbi:MAG: hypothetical protein ABII12_14440 [Planctomycetota bacterium]